MPRRPSQASAAALAAAERTADSAAPDVETADERKRANGAGTIALRHSGEPVRVPRYGRGIVETADARA